MERISLIVTAIANSITVFSSTNRRRASGHLTKLASW
jgi:hypothetical protein